MSIRLTGWITRLLLGCLALWAAPFAWANPASHALLIGISRYDSSTGASPLPGVPFDMESAAQIARKLNIPPGNIRVLRDAEATKAGIVKAIETLASRVAQGGRALIYFSGHGTRWFDPDAQGCVEGLFSYDGGVIVNREFVALTKALRDKTDKLIVMFDACHSGGVASTGIARSLATNFSPKFFAKTNVSAQSCSIPSNLKTRSLLGEAKGAGFFAENIIHISSSRPDEVSFDEPGRGGLATQAIRDCMFGEAKDLDNSGAVTLAEVETCARQHVRRRLAQHPELLPHHPIISGQRNLIASAPPLREAQSSSAEKPIAPPAVLLNTQNEEAARRREELRLEQERLTQLARAERDRQQAAEAARQRERAEELRREQERIANERRAAERLAEQRAREEAQAREQAEKQRLAAERARLEAEAQRLEQVAEQTRQRVAAEEKLAQQSLADQTNSATITTPLLGPAATLEDILAQSDPRRAMSLQLKQTRLKIDRDELALTVSSQRDGYLYLIHVEPDLQNFTLLFPNALQPDNRVRAKQPINLPRVDWRLVSAGPPGTSRILAIVSDQARDVSLLPEVSGSAPFSQVVTDIPGRSRMISFVLADNSPFGAALVEVEEYR